LGEEDVKGLEEALAVLKSVAAQFPKESQEHQAIELAAKALLYVFQEDVERRFKSFLRDFDSELTAEQKQNLRRIGIEVD